MAGRFIVLIPKLDRSRTYSNGTSLTEANRIWSPSPRGVTTPHITPRKARANLEYAAVDTVQWTCVPATESARTNDGQAVECN